MGNFVAIHVLRQYNPGLFNRGDDGTAKQVTIGGINRVRFSSQCQKRAIREMMACEEIRTASIEVRIWGGGGGAVADGTITEEEKDVIGEAICSKGIIGTDCWKFLKGADGNRNVVTTNAGEITSLVTFFVNYAKENGLEDFYFKKKGKDGKETVDKVKLAKLTALASDEALKNINASIAKSMFGCMSTDGALGTIDGAVEMGQAFSVDEYLVEPDYVSVKYVGRSGANDSDPFFGVYENFTEQQNKKRSSETIQSGLPLYSNLMYSYSNVNIKELARNLNMNTSATKYIGNQNVEEIIEKVVPEYVQAMIQMTPEATQNRSSSHVAPCVVLVEVIKDGENLQPDWGKVIRATEDKSIAEQAIERLGGFAQDNTFRSGDIKQYVMISNEYKDLLTEFPEAEQIKNFKELKEVLKTDVKDMI